MSGYGAVSKYVDERVLTPLQKRFVEAYLPNGKNIAKTAAAINISTHHCYDILKSARVQLELARHVKSMCGYMRVVNKYRISKSFRLEMLWNVAQECAGMVYDRQGNEVLMNPRAAVKAIRTMNDIESWPKQRPVKIEARDERSIDEVHASSQQLIS